MEILRPGDRFPASGASCRVERLIGKGKSAHSYLARRGGARVVLKVMHDEPNPYYRFEGNRADPEREAYRSLLRIGIPVPRLLLFDREKRFLVKEYLEGPTAAERIAGGGDPSSMLPGLFSIARLARRSGLNLDWFPTNFLLRRERLFYIDYEVNEYDPEWSLENWGLFYWANEEGMARFLETGDPSFINDPPESGRPIEEPFRKKVGGWVERFGDGGS
ncbi:MAG: hypothetical protein JW958_07215 [Candidatus Eisenbacteria bacterium]|nr:hypothetical protein [Candidatus Eisenbacteria bacterium]